MKKLVAFAAFCLVYGFAFSDNSSKPTIICPELMSLMGLIESNPQQGIVSFVAIEELMAELRKIAKSSSTGSFENSFAAHSMSNIEQLVSVRTTRSGARFTKVSLERLESIGIKDPTKFGPAWRDPSGVIWSTVRVEAGSPLVLTQSEAHDYCAALGAQLLSGWRESENKTNGNRDSDFVRLLKYMTTPTGKYEAQILPALFTDMAIEIDSDSPRVRQLDFWSSSEFPADATRFFIFDAIRGNIDTDHRGNKGPRLKSSGVLFVCTVRDISVD